MKKLVFSIFLAWSFLGLNSAAAETMSSQTVTAILSPFVTVSNEETSSINTRIVDGGRLLTDLSPSFKFISNNKNGTVATFNVKVNTSDSGQVDGMYGNNNSGKIVLVNASLSPGLNAIKNALSDNPSSANNPNAIAYQISFKVSDKDIGNIPVFDKSGTSASGNVLVKNGSNRVSLVIHGDSVVKNSYGSEDESGSYQAIIYCTSANL